MAAKRNPQNILWKDPTTYTDGSAFGASDFKAYELGASTSASTPPTSALLSLPVTLGVGKSPIPDAVKDIRGVQFLHLRTLDNYGQFSEWSSPGVEVQFTGRPLAPSSVDCS
jgi:hypothetical protein